MYSLRSRPCHNHPPLSGETDQETLRNISTAALDFPAELFEGVSEEAKEFIKECLSRNPK